MPKAFDQRLRHRSEARADFHHGLACYGRDGLNNVFNDAPVGQKVLTKPLARDVAHLNG